MPQFYNNPSCNLNSGQSFMDSVQAWSNDITQLPPNSFNNINNGISSPRLLIGVPASTTAGSGYVDPSSFRGILEGVRGLGLGNLGGVGVWDGAYEEVGKSAGGGVGFAEVVRDVLG
jgi:hypothetical protein